MTRAELEAIALRVEREEPSAALAMQVIIACGWSRPNGPKANQWHHPVHGWRSGGPDPLHSLDAAASLVGDRPYVLRRMPSGRNMATIPAGKDVVLGKTKNPPAAALTAAALRALAQEPQK